MIRWARLGDYALEGLSVGLVVVIAVGFYGYAGRRVLVGELAERYLQERGVQAEIEVLAVDARGFVGRVRLGPAADPDFAAERVEVLLAAPPPPEGPYALRPTRIRVIGPRVKARWTGRGISLGELDPLIEEALSRPSDPTRPSPRVLIEDGSFRLFTPYGLVAGAGGGVVADSRLERLDLALQPALLKNGASEAALRGGSARVRVDGAQADLGLDLRFDRLSDGREEARTVRLTASGYAPYLDIRTRRAAGPVELALGLTSAETRSGDVSATDARLELAVDGSLSGPLERLVFAGLASADAEADELRTPALQSRSARAALRLADANLTFSGGALSGRAAVQGRLSAAEATLADARLQTVAADLRSADLSFTASPGGLSATGPASASARADRFTRSEVSGTGLQLAAATRALTFRDGRWVGPVNLHLRAASLAAGPGRATGLSGELVTDLGVLSGPANLQGVAQAGRMTLAGENVPLNVADARLRFDGRAGPGSLQLDLSVAGRGALPFSQARRIAADLPIVGDSPAYTTAIARALGGFQAEAADLRLADGELRLTGPVRVRTAAGARLELTPRGARALAVSNAGPFRLTVAGGGLPDLTAEVDRLALTAGGGFDATGRLRAALDIPLAEGAVVDARGSAVSRDGVFSFSAADCVAFRAARVELGENDLAALSGRLCPTPDAPMVRAGSAGYRVQGRFSATAASVPFLQARTEAASGALDASGAAAGLTNVAVQLASAEVLDAAPERRFHPLALTGTAELDDGVWRAALDILDAPAGVNIAEASLVHAAVSGQGGVNISAPGLRFAPDGLQPHDLSPLAAGLVSDVDGVVDFTGRIAWTAGALPTSVGRLSLREVSLEGPLGPTAGVSGEIVLSSLTPLVAPPGQVVTAERIEAFTPLTAVRAEFGFTDTALQLASARFGVAGGTVTVEPLTLPFAPDPTMAGALVVDDVELGALVAETGVADRVKLDAVVDGRIPFRFGPAGLRVTGGSLRSVRPGRLSISREALTQVGAAESAATPAPSTEGEAALPAAAAATPPNAFQEFAYQALENLAYSELDVALDSRPEGRLGLVFSIRGRHDPPQPEEARISIMDLLRGRAFQRRIPLPDGAPVNLTLDSSVNLDELLADYGALRQAQRRSDAVQP